MTTRRTFLKQSGAVAIGGMITRVGWAETAAVQPSLPAPGLQLYTIGGKLDEDLDGTLRRVAEIGYKNLESAFSRKGGYYGLAAKDFAAKVTDLGMRWISHHAAGAPFRPRPGNEGRTPAVVMKNLKEHHQEIVDEIAGAGLPYLVCPGIPIGNKEEVDDAVKVLTKTGEACRKAGITFAFHNHTKEFEKVDGDKTAMDIFLSEIPEDILKIELDLAWAVKAGADPLTLFKNSRGRFPLWHVKDLDKDQKPTEVGTGSVDFKTIFESAKTAGLQYYFVEQDAAPSPMENINNSYNNLKKILG
jgi:sugar phosphate isomerase/epimerase